MIVSVFLLALQMLVPSSELHKHYVSIAEMEFNKKEKKIESSVQVTGHDLEYAINKLSGTNFKLKPVQTDRSDSTIILTEQYIQDKFNIEIKDKQINPKVIGIENKNDGNAYIYVIFEGIKKVNQVELKNTILMDHFSAQQNIAHLKVGEQKKTRTFTQKLRKQTLDFKK